MTNDSVISKDAVFREAVFSHHRLFEDEEIPLAKCTVLHLYNMYDRLLQANSESSGAVMAAYANTLDMLSTIAAEENLNVQDRRWFAEKAVEVADKMAAFDRENKGFLEGIFKVGACILGGGLLLGAALLGINIRASRDTGA